MPNSLTKKQYDQLCNDRAAMVKSLLMQTVSVPKEYALTDERRTMYGNSLLAMRPLHVVTGSRMINFIH